MELTHGMLSVSRIIRLLIVLLAGVAIWKMWTYFDSSSQQNPRLVDEIKEMAPVTEPLHVAVFYEALCPDSRQFVRVQLRSAIEKLHEHISLQMVPYGKAKTEETAGELSFQCQHGPTECLANKVHACVTKHVPDTLQQLHIISCMIDNNRQPVVVGKKCVTKTAGAATWAAVEDCTSSRVGDQILKHMGSLTDSLSPSVHFIPTVTVDKSQDGQPSILKDFTKFLCGKFRGAAPASCGERL